MRLFDSFVFILVSYKNKIKRKDEKNNKKNQVDWLLPSNGATIKKQTNKIIVRHASGIVIVFIEKNEWKSEQSVGGDEIRKEGRKNKTIKNLVVYIKRRRRRCAFSYILAPTPASRFM